MTPLQPQRGIKDSIQVFTGIKFFPLDPRAEDIHLADIARALSMQCRYAGHVWRFYSVAEHACRVARRVLKLTGSPVKALQGLHHDDSEGYLGDVTRPVKRQPALAGYRLAEEVLQPAIYERFSLPRLQWGEVTAVDTEILGTEAVQLKSPIHPDWAKTTATGQLPPPLPVGRIGLIPARAEGEYLWLHRELNAMCLGTARPMPRLRRFGFVAAHILRLLCTGQIL